MICQYHFSTAVADCVERQIIDMTRNLYIVLLSK